MLSEYRSPLNVVVSYLNVTLSYNCNPIKRFEPIVEISTILSPVSSPRSVPSMNGHNNGRFRGRAADECDGYSDWNSACFVTAWRFSSRRIIDGSGLPYFFATGGDVFGRVTSVDDQLRVTDKFFPVETGMIGGN